MMARPDQAVVVTLSGGVGVQRTVGSARWVVALVVAALVVGLASSAVAQAAATGVGGHVGGGKAVGAAGPALQKAAGQFVPVGATTVLSGAAVAAGSTTMVTVAGVGGVPAAGQVSAVAVQVAVDGTTTAGYATVYPGGATRPSDSSVNFVAAGYTAAYDVVPLSASGTLSVFCSQDCKVYMRLRGYFTSSSAAVAGSTYVPVAPKVLVNAVSLAAGGTSSVTVAGNNGVPIASEVSAVALAVVSSGSSAAGSVKTYPTGGAAPSDSTVWWPVAGDSVSNFETSTLSTTGSVTFSSTAATKLTVRLLGYYLPPSAAGTSPTTAGSTFVPTTHATVVNNVAVVTAGTTTAAFTGANGVPAPAQVAAVAMNGVSNAPTAAGYLTAWTAGATRPSDAIAYYKSGTTVAGYEPIVPSSVGQVSFYASGATKVLARLRGYYRKAGVPAAPARPTTAAGDGKVTVSWTEPADGGAAITGYTVTASPGGRSVTVGPQASVVVDGLSNGTIYTFTVKATNAVGAGPPSLASLKVVPMGGEVLYAHDAAGRLAAAFSSDGDGVGYVYDADDNLTDIVARPSGTLAVLQAGPASTVAGATYEVYGTGFGTDPEAVAVTVGGVAATAVTLRRNHITLTIPAGTGGGPVVLTVAGHSLSAGTVSVLGAPSISGTSTTLVDRSAAFTISGANFDTRPAGDTVLLAGTRLPVLSATGSSLRVRAPGFGMSGTLSVRTLAGEAAFDAVITVPPTPFLAADVPPGVPDLAMGTASTVATTTSNQITLFTVKAAAGRRLGFQIKATLSGCYEMHVWTPQKTAALAKESICSSQDYFDLPTPTAGGYYLVELDPRNEVTASFTVTVREATDVAVAVTIDGATGTAAVTTAPQHATFTFAGAKGQLVFTSLAATSGSAEGATLLGPHGQKLATSGFYSSTGGYLAGTLLPEAGTYTVDVDPDDWNPGTYTATVISVPAPAQASTSVDGVAAAINISKPGQTAAVSITGTAGQIVHVDLAPGAGTISSGTLDLRAPDGSFLLQDRTWSSFLTGEGDRLTLTQSGEYLLLLDPDGAQAGAFTVPVTTIPDDVQATATVGGPAVTVGNTRPGQNAKLLFTAAEGQRIAVLCDGVSADALTVGLKLLDPSGAAVDGTSVCSKTPQTLLFDARTYAAGTWTILLNPDRSVVDTRTLRVLAVPADAAVSTTVDSSPTTLTLAPAQNASLSFPVTAGQRFGVSCSVANPDQQYDVRFTLLRPDGSYQTSASCYTSNTGLLFEPPSTVMAGTWLIKIDPSTTSSVSLTLKVASVPADLDVATTPGAAGTNLALSPAQNGTVSFPVTAGQRFVIGCTLSDTTRQYDVSYKVLKPDGTSAATTNCYDSSHGMILDTTTATTAGTWKVVVDPKGWYSITAGVRVYAVPADVSKAITVGGAAVAVSTTVGQAAKVTLTSSASQKVKISFASSTYPTCADYVYLRDSAGTSVGGSCLTSGQSLTAQLQTGTYTLSIDPDYLYAGSVSVSAAVTTQVAPQRSPARSATAAPARRLPAGEGLATQAGHAAPAADDDDHGNDDEGTDAPVYPKARPATLSGRILRTDGVPLGNVTVRVADRSTRTGADGRFRLSRLPAGTFLVVMDGRTASTAGKSYGYFDQQVGLHRGRNRLGYQPYLPVLDTANQVKVTYPLRDDVVIRTPKVPGLEVHLPKGTKVTDADGKPVTTLGITPIPVNRTPIPMPKGVQVPVYFTVQPAGGHIEEFPDGRYPQIYYPNYLNQKPGTQVNFWTHEKRAEGWEVYGQGSVTLDGTQVRPDDDTYIENLDGAMINVTGWPKALLGGLQEGLGLGGDPVDLSTGRFVLTQTDLSVGGALPIVMSRSYSSGDGRDRPFGMGGIGTYDTFLTSDRQWQEADLNLPDGARVHFVRTSPGSGYTDAIMAAKTASPEYAGATMSWNGRGWDLVRRDGTVLIYGELAPLQSIRDRNGNTLTIRRIAKNAWGNQIGAIVSVTSTDGYWMAYDYDTAGHVTAVHDNAGRTVSYGYDTANRLTTVTDPLGGVTTYGWTGNNLTTITDARGKQYLTTEYDANGRVKKQTQADRSTYDFAWTLDGTGKNVTSVTLTDPSGADRVVDYDEAGYLVKDRVAVGTPVERGYSVGRDPTTHIATTVTDTDGRTATSTYNANLQATSTTYSSQGQTRTQSATYAGPGGAMDTVTDALGHVTRYGFDARGNVTTVTDPAGRVTTMTWNTDGTPATLKRTGENATSYEYLSGALTSVTDPAGRRTEFSTDDVGRLIGVLGPDGAVTSTSYDAANHVTSTTDALDRTTTIGYDPNGNTTSVTDPTGARSSWRYDDMDRVSTWSDPLGKQATVTYTVMGRPATTTDRRGNLTEFRYDVLQRPTFTGWARTGSPGAYTYQSTQSTTYDGRGRLASVTDTAPGAGTLTYGYDAWDRMTTEQTTAPGSAGTTTRTWDDADRLTSTQLTGLPKVTYGYDNGDALTSVTQAGLTSTTTLDPAGRESARTLPGGITRTQGFDAGGNLTSIGYAAAGGSIGGLTYAYDRGGRLSRTGGEWARTTLPTPLSGATFDAADRLTAAGGITYGYDDDGNLTSRASPTGTSTYTWDARGQLRAAGGESGSSTLDYDAAGRRTRTTVDGDTWVNRYDGTELAAQDGPAAVPGSDLAFMRGGSVDDVLATIGGSDSEGHPDGSGGASSTSASLTDRMGSVLATVTSGSSTGQLARQYTYGPFGSATSTPTESDPNPVRWTGRESGPGVPGGDAGGLQYNRARWYDPNISRFLSQDPAGFAGSGTNAYAYVGNDPVDATDPTGQYAQLVAGCLIGAGVSTATAALSGRKHGVAAYTGVALGGCAMGLFEGFALTKALGDVNRTARLLETTHRIRTTVAAKTATGAESSVNGARLGTHLRQLEKYGQGGFRELESGRFRYYGDLSSAAKQGEMAGRRLVREWDPASGATRTWHETLDHSGNVRIVRPETGGSKTHYYFDEFGGYGGAW